MVASVRQTLSSIRRDAWVEIDLGALERNVQTIRSWIKDSRSLSGKESTKLVGVVKSDGYGHGAVQVAELLVGAGTEWLAVASVDEGRQLREAGLTVPVLILSPAPKWAVANALEADLDLTVTSAAQIADIYAIARPKGLKARVQVKVDSGMHRLGATPAQVPALLKRIESCLSSIELRGLFSHLARADEESFTRKQVAAFRQCIDMARASKMSPQFFHIASGDAARLFPFTHMDAVRVGLQLYGLESRTVSSVVQPIMSVRARINHIQEIAEGDSVGYNLTWTAGRPSRLASVPIGYADGVDRGLSNRMTGLLMGYEVKQAGLISMDQMLFDITDVEEAQEGDVITLIGSESGLSRRTMKAGYLKREPDKTLYLAEWAQMLDTITYELASRLRVRLPRIYTRQRQVSGAADD